MHREELSQRLLAIFHLSTVYSTSVSVFQDAIGRKVCPIVPEQREKMDCEGIVMFAVQKGESVCVCLCERNTQCRMQVWFPGQQAINKALKRSQEGGNKMSQPSGTGYGINPFGKSGSAHTSTTNNNRFNRTRWAYRAPPPAAEDATQMILLPLCSFGGLHRKGGRRTEMRSDWATSAFS